MSRFIKKIAVLTAAAAMLVAPSAFAQGMDNEVGKAAYETSCAVCHGSTGAGDGEFAEFLTITPSDLTMLAKNNNGEFPFLQVFQTVDGRTQVRGHGSQMPIWGDMFAREIGESAGPFGAELMIRAQIVALVDYIESLQAE